MQATYFNQRPINIARAEWKLRDGLLMMYVELRDVNYPGSAYKLQYNPASDQLEGIYFQAVDKQNFGIFFTRKKSD